MSKGGSKTLLGQCDSVHTTPRFSLCTLKFSAGDSLRLPGDRRGRSLPLIYATMPQADSTKSSLTLHLFMSPTEAEQAFTVWERSTGNIHIEPDY